MVANVSEKTSAYMGFSYKYGPKRGQRAESEGYREGLAYKVTINPRKRNMADDKDIKILLASIWLWANLGGIGQRARRGFGSVVIEVEETNNPFKEYFKDSTLNIIKQHFKDSRELEDYLKNGIKACWQIFHSWCITNKIANFNPLYMRLLRRSIINLSSSLAVFNKLLLVKGVWVTSLNLQ